MGQAIVTRQRPLPVGNFIIGPVEDHCRHAALGGVPDRVAGRRVGPVGDTTRLHRESVVVDTLPGLDLCPPDCLEDVVGMVGAGPHGPVVLLEPANIVVVDAERVECDIEVVGGFVNGRSVDQRGDGLVACREVPPAGV